MKSSVSKGLVSWLQDWIARYNSTSQVYPQPSGRARRLCLAIFVYKLFNVPVVVAALVVAAVVGAAVVVVAVVVVAAVVGAVGVGVGVGVVGAAAASTALG